MNPNIRLHEAIEYIKNNTQYSTNTAISVALKYRSETYISDLVRGGKPVTEFFLERLQKRFRINPQWILSGSGDMITNEDDNNVESDDNYFATNLRIIRAKWEVSQEEFADLIGATRGMIMQYENRNTMPKDTTLNDIGAVVGIPPTSLLTTVILPDEINEKPTDVFSTSVQKDILDQVTRIINKQNFRFPIAKIAEDSGWKKSNISSMLSGKKTISKKFYAKIMELYGDGEKAISSNQHPFKTRENEIDKLITEIEYLKKRIADLEADKTFLQQIISSRITPLPSFQ